MKGWVAAAESLLALFDATSRGLFERWIGIAAGNHGLVWIFFQPLFIAFGSSHGDYDPSPPKLSTRRSLT